MKAYFICRVTGWRLFRTQLRLIRVKTSTLSHTDLKSLTRTPSV
ncbi:hypothetical protein HanXRQr2_Chr16g0756941 [Helianthus annuus]|uniref:Uncharacterized protein n=1 Tax=Helianthus annuus TaxID=4232 RepID=A0A9K3GYK4_HELAN|nr:hypothetical protein HanXRQr2_Chr16g0756941 [Helianthus annuus]KAJ0438720.1 hypothetical protein HanHA300_Chr16g0617291 [Helianthus annuus]KAJ0443596.1 hypothetical protein HanIR_Chr16g0822531 [Helianthus annuus]KAJ0461073.1 hypothetical protein HanHA89_Chr16g0668201 [Helianthus annuus]KAJ0641498.1 hypothetical protein HanLR1_Chr16g0627921 [Helianthus annuus]